MVLAGLACMLHPVVGVVVLIGGLVASSKIAKARAAARLAELTALYGAENADRIIRGVIWQGASPAMIVESIGDPADIDEKVFKTKTKQVYKYAQKGKNSFLLRITFEDGVCVGWDDKR